MKPRHPVNPKAYVRAVIAIALLISWSLAAFTGFLLWFAPRGARNAGWAGWQWLNHLSNRSQIIGRV
ncbi:hypothetical protein HUN01_32400 [Nostoc edaphicum CCNP1411]|uniref:Uncharacterized protein n=1 Tax=Nostoc edaphicum CCNP1411 TaxID=1472755 RepID=A0A7D7QBQ8_9NOSO|nr:hypothetical protein [Nostoc edaphicum]QMS92077.1 hypothetical protein HUN01_32400 [Nostoc edaphicum CCNP1411]